MPETKKYSILVADNQKTNIVMLTGILNSEYTVYATDNGQEAIQLAEKYLPDIILLDIVMRNTDGYSVITALKKSEITQRIPIIFITGLNHSEEEKEFTMGAADYITKPFTPAIVKLRIKNQITMLNLLHTVEYDTMKYKLANKAMNIALWDMDVAINEPTSPNNKITWSQELRNMLGFSDESDFPNTITALADRFHPEDREMAFAAFAAHFNDCSGRTPYDVEYRLKHKNGEYRYFDGFGTTLRNSKGIPLRVSGAVRDITEKKQIEKELGQQNKLLRAVNRSASLLLTAENNEIFKTSFLKSMEIIGRSMDADSVEIWQNEMRDGELYAALKHYWFSETGAKIRTVSSVLSFPYSASPKWESRLSQGSYIQGPISGFSREDQEFLSIFNVKTTLVIPIFIQKLFWGFCCIDNYRISRNFTEYEVDILHSGSLLLANALFHNEMIEQLKAAVSRAHEGEERMQLMLDVMPLACRLINRDYKIIDCNQEAVNFFAAPSKEAYCEKYNAFLPEFQPCGRRSNDLNIKYLRRAFNEGYLRFEWMYQRLDGELLPCEVTLVCVKYKGENVIASYSRDLREQKAVAEEIRKAEIAEESNKAKSRFLATMSHEIRTPMNSIMGFAELAMSKIDEPQVKDYLEKITDSTKWLLNIINDILDISKIESGKMELECIPFDLYDVISRCQSVILPSVKDKGLDLSIYAEPLTDKKLLGDSVRLCQALINLLSNAVKFTNAGTVKFSSLIKCSNDNNAVVYFEVKDSGIGINSGQIEKIFDPFIQADSSMKRKYGGTGLGLAITKNIIELMGGKLTVESSPGAGSVFSFEITFKTIDAASDVPDNADFGHLEKPNFSDGCLILVCDDNITNQQVICEHLKHIGIKAAIAENGKIGVGMVKERMLNGEKPFDLILMDIFMPIMDGIEATGEIAALNTGTPIVAMTANVMISELENYRKHGMLDCIGKPFTAQELWRILLKYLTPINSATVGKDNNNELQRKLQINFVKSNQTLYAEITNAIKTGDIKLAHRLMHSLKGNAGMIGKTELQSIAEDIEASLKNGEILIAEDKMNLLKIELTSALEELKPLLGVSFAKKPDYATFEKIKSMLENINPEVVNLLDDIRAIPGTEELARQIENYDFETAAKTLDELFSKV